MFFFYYEQSTSASAHLKYGYVTIAFLIKSTVGNPEILLPTFSPYGGADTELLPTNPGIGT